MPDTHLQHSRTAAAALEADGYWESAERTATDVA